MKGWIYPLLVFSRISEEVLLLPEGAGSSFESFTAGCSSATAGWLSVSATLSPSFGNGAWSAYAEEHEIATIVAAMRNA